MDYNKNEYAKIKSKDGLLGLDFLRAAGVTIKSKNLLVQSHTSHIDTKLKDFRVREAIYV